MNFSQLHERLRLELLRRIDRELLTAASLARQTGLQQPHISNFLRSKRRLSLPAMDRVLAALAIGVEDLLVPSELALAPSAVPPDFIPLVSASIAINDAFISPSAAFDRIQLPAGSLDDLRLRQPIRRRDWQRFVAVGVTPAQAQPMEPVLAPNNILVLDRHYTAVAEFSPLQPNIYAVRQGNALLFRYVTFDANRLILRPHGLNFPIQLIEVEPLLSPSDLIVGRVCFVIARR
jgi:transcriptional regulator with XRE-family HTH domain